MLGNCSCFFFVIRWLISKLTLKKNCFKNYQSIKMFARVTSKRQKTPLAWQQHMFANVACFNALRINNQLMQKNSVNDRSNNKCTIHETKLIAYWVLSTGGFWQSFFSHRHISQRAIWAPLSSNWTRDPFASRGGSIPVFLKKPVATCDFPVGVWTPWPHHWICHTLMVFLKVYLFCLRFYVPVNIYGHIEMVSS